MISVKDIEFKYGSELSLNIKNTNAKEGKQGTEYKYLQGFILKITNLEVKKGESLAITGVSGSGKSTLLKLLSGELTLQFGSISILGHNLHEMKESELRNFRLKQLGMIFQDSPLLEYLSVADNISMPAEIAGLKDLQDVKELATNCGIEDLLSRYPSKLSEGEKQRAAICRALIASPKLVLADEPTSSLDPTRGQDITDLLIKSCRKQNCSLVMVTHDHSLLSKFDRTVDMNELGGKNA